MQGVHGLHIAFTLDKVNYLHTAVTHQGVLLNVAIFISTLEVYGQHVGITHVIKIKCLDVVGWNPPTHTHTHTHTRAHARTHTQDYKHMFLVRLCSLKSMSVSPAAFVETLARL
jgi:hypothetical protein